MRANWIVGLVILVLLGQVSAEQPRYAVEEVCFIYGWVVSPLALTADGSVLYSYGDGTININNYYLYKWSDGGATRLPVPGRAAGMNDLGTVIGDNYRVGETYRGYTWQEGEVAVFDAPARLTFPRDINDAGRVVGWAGESYSDCDAFIWEDGQFTFLGSLGGNETRGHAINASAQVAGRSELPNGDEHAFLWSGDQLLDLGTLGGDDSDVYDINDHGQVVGWARAADGQAYPFLYDNGVMTAIGEKNSHPLAINNAGEIVGHDSHGRALLIKDGVVYDLTSLIVSGEIAPSHLDTAHEINESGQILARAGFGGSRLYLLSPIVPLTFDDQAAGDSNWSTPGNWDDQPDPGTDFPNSLTEATIGSDHTVDVVTPGHVAYSLNVTDTATLNIATAANPTTGDLTVGGTVSVGPTATLNVYNTLTAETVVSSGRITLGDNSTVSGAVTVTAGSLTTGAGVMVGALTVESGAGYEWGFDKTGGVVTGGLLAVDGDLTLDDNWILSFLPAAGSEWFDGTEQVDLFSFTGTLTGDLANVLFDAPTDWITGAVALYQDIDRDGLGINYIGMTGLETVPEPATLSMLALGGLAVIRRRRRK